MFKNKKCEINSMGQIESQRCLLNEENENCTHNQAW